MTHTLRALTRFLYPPTEESLTGDAAGNIPGTPSRFCKGNRQRDDTSDVHHGRVHRKENHFMINPT